MWGYRLVDKTEGTKERDYRRNKVIYYISSMKLEIIISSSTWKKSNILTK
jgi:hypothetical protein